MAEYSERESPLLASVQIHLHVLFSLATLPNPSRDVGKSPEEGWSETDDSCSLAIFSRLQAFLAATIYRLGLSGPAK